jgi:hypothetical protein
MSLISSPCFTNPQATLIASTGHSQSWNNGWQIFVFAGNRNLSTISLESSTNWKLCVDSGKPKIMEHSGNIATDLTSLYAQLTI